MIDIPEITPDDISPDAAGNPGGRTAENFARLAGSCLIDLLAERNPVHGLLLENGAQAIRAALASVPGLAGPREAAIYLAHDYPPPWPAESRAYLIAAAEHLLRGPATDTTTRVSE